MHFVMTIRHGLTTNLDEHYPALFFLWQNGMSTHTAFSLIKLRIFCHINLDSSSEGSFRQWKLYGLFWVHVQNTCWSHKFRFVWLLVQLWTAQEVREGWLYITLERTNILQQPPWLATSNNSLLLLHYQSGSHTQNSIYSSAPGNKLDRTCFTVAVDIFVAVSSSIFTRSFAFVLGLICYFHAKICISVKRQEVSPSLCGLMVGCLVVLLSSVIWVVFS